MSDNTMKPWTTPIKEIAPNAILVDLDGTLAIHSDRSPYDYSKLLQDGFNYHLWYVIKDMNIIFLTGRPGKPQIKTDTITWLKTYTGILNNEFYDQRLLMRMADDHRTDSIIKSELYEQEIEPYYNIIAVFEDRDRNVVMWRDKGLFCCQVNYGDF